MALDGREAVKKTAVGLLSPKEVEQEIADIESAILEKESFVKRRNMSLILLLMAA